MGFLDQLKKLDAFKEHIHLTTSYSHTYKKGSRDYSTSYNYEPGSTLKPFSILAGLKNKKIKLSDKYYCENGEYYISDIDRTIEDHDENDTLSVKEILAHSSNIGVAKISSDIGKKDIYETVKSFGFGQETGIYSYGEDYRDLKKINRFSQL